MKILFASAEVTPIVKVGGLADVVGALPKALHVRGHDVRIVIPKYAAIDQNKFPSEHRLESFTIPWRGRSVAVHLDQGVLPHSVVPVYYLDAPDLFSVFRGVYFQSGDTEAMREEIERFVFFSWAVCQVFSQFDWRPDIVHVHDWHTAAIALFARLHRQSSAACPPVALTIHNLQSQGRWSAEEVWSWLGLRGDEAPTMVRRDRLGSLNLLQQGILSAAAVNTVSPTYAKEILTPAFGEGLEDDLRARPGGIHGVLNGIDIEAFDPAIDPNLIATYSTDTVDDGKAKNKQHLQSEVGLPSDPSSLLIGSVGRLAPQKGYQLLPDVIDGLMDRPTQLVILGSGTPDLQRLVADLGRRFPARVKVIERFDASLAQRIYAGADVFLMPSVFEPCGLGQLIAMRYGTIPIVHAVGGLKDTVVDLTAHPDRGTGFVFQNFSGADLLTAVDRALRLHDHHGALGEVRRRGMNQDFSWHRSAKTYEHLYEKIIASPAR